MGEEAEQRLLNQKSQGQEGSLLVFVALEAQRGVYVLLVQLCLGEEEVCRRQRGPDFGSAVVHGLLKS